MFILFIHFAEFEHLLVDVEEVTIGIIERHCDEIGVEHFLVFAGNCLDAAVFVDFIGDVLCCVYDVE